MVLKEEEEAWPEVQEEMNRSLATMRVDYDQVFFILHQTRSSHGIIRFKVIKHNCFFYHLGCIEIFTDIK